MSSILLFMMHKKNHDVLFYFLIGKLVNIKIFYVGDVIYTHIKVPGRTCKYLNSYGCLVCVCKACDVIIYELYGLFIL